MKIIIKEPLEIRADPQTGAMHLNLAELRELKTYTTEEHPAICAALLALRPSMAPHERNEVFIMENGIPAQVLMRAINLAEDYVAVVVQMMTQVQKARPDQIPPHPAQGGPGPNQRPGPRLVQP